MGEDMTLLQTVTDDLKSDEGWRAKSYLDHLGVPTIGYGFTWLTKEEGEFLLNNRVRLVYSQLSLQIKGFEELPPMVQRALINMAYQLGIEGLLKFRKTIRYIEAGRYKEAADEALDSLWAKQTPNRAKRVTNWMRGA